MLRTVARRLKVLPLRLSVNLSRRVRSIDFVSRMSTNAGRIESEEFQSVLTPELLKLSNAISERGYDVRIVGGAVRDLLLGKAPKDVDLSTNATPEQMMEVFNADGIRFIETGLQHGTLTVHINKRDFEVTTLRTDTETDGRHAKVTFTHDWRVDAERRDLTINAMSLGLDGDLYDYFGGREDLTNRIVRFVGNPRLRIEEDYLRILRYFRFYGKIAEQPDKHDQATLDIIRDTAEGLRRIAVERVWVEVAKILTGNYAASLLQLMDELTVSKCIGEGCCCSLLASLRPMIATRYPLQLQLGIKPQDYTPHSITKLYYLVVVIVNKLMYGLPTMWELLLTTYWPHTDRLYWPLLPTIYQLHTNHIPTTYQPDQLVHYYQNYASLYIQLY